MGLFGLFCTAITGGVFLTDSIKNTSLDSKWKQDAIRNGNITWTDSHGKKYLVSTGEQVFYSGDKLITVKGGRVVYDYKKERVNKYNRNAIAKAKAEGKKGASLIYPEFDDRQYHTELSTMKRYYLLTNSQHYEEATKFYKVYYTKNKKNISSIFDDIKDEKIEITKEEFLLLDGGVRFPKLYTYNF